MHAECTQALAVPRRNRHAPGMTGVDTRPYLGPLDGQPVMRVSILGFGRFGRALGTLLLEAGVDLRAWDESTEIPPEIRASSLENLAEHAEIFVFAVPVPAFQDALTRMAPLFVPSQLVLDVGSVKIRPEAAMRRILGRQVAWVATHPLFGPVSMARGERPLSVVVCPNDLHPGAETRAQALFARIGCDVVFQSADDHDRIMAETHALAFFVAKGLIDANDAATYPFTPPSFKAMEKTISAVRSDAGHLFFAIQHENPHAATSRRRLLDALERIDDALAAVSQGAEPQPQPQTQQKPEPKQKPTGEASPVVLGAPTVSTSPEILGRSAERKASTSGSNAGTGDTSPLEMVADPAENRDLLETRELIDEIDRELVELLARRAQLSRRAGWAKAALGREVADQQREHLMLRSRQDWAHALNLDPGFVDALFRLVLTHSRAVQQR